MRLADFRIGLEFHTATGRWRCTDVGSRTVVAISLEPHETVMLRRDADGHTLQEGSMTDDLSWLNGPPFAVAEHVFDEDGIEGCYQSAEAMRADLRA